jgi:Ser/Thr protein kinase RdoA (MazF antagonist)
VPDLARIASHFCLRGEYQRAERVRSGHINEGHVAWFRTAGGEARRYLLQRINDRVFSSPERLMENVEAVTAHLRAKLKAAGSDPDREALTLVRTVDGGVLHRTRSGEYWRAMYFIEGASSHEQAAGPGQVRGAGRAFGRFLALLSDFPVERLHETIPGFHHTPGRVKALRDAVRRDIAGRAQAARDEIAFVEERAATTAELLDLLEAGTLPLRVTHNDTKLDNVLIDDETGEGICVIDLDTVMPGLAAYDFGDAVRSMANSAAEDERDLDRVSLDLEAYEQLIAGYLEGAGGCLTPAEIDSLTTGARLMTLECGIRFLTDHLEGDRYFRTRRPGHNLDRCRTQFKLVRQMESERAEMERIIDRYRPPAGFDPG